MQLPTAHPDLLLPRVWGQEPDHQVLLMTTTHLSPLFSLRSNQSILKEINPECSLEGLMLRLKLQYSGHLMRRANSLEKTLKLGKTKGRRRRG